MPDIAVTPVNGAQYFGATTPRKTSELNMETFLRLLTTQLANQNPLEPMNDRDFFAQMAQLGTVQGLDKISNNDEITQANQLIGKSITATRPNAAAGDTDYVQGVVRGLIIRNGDRFLQVQESNGGIVEIQSEHIRAVGDSAVSSSVQQILDAASAANLIGKKATAYHPTQKNADGSPLEFDGTVDKVSFEKGTVYLTMKDRLGTNVKVSLSNVLSFSN
ncbi:MAG: hypothetical protein JNJ45_04600 [Chthonomonas sp.]|nr:hypothetical protein [Chthonomonas sp.]